MFYNFRMLTIAALMNRHNCFEWMQSEGLVPSVMLCPECQAKMRVYVRGKANAMYRCQKGNHDIAINATTNTFFAHSSYSLVNIVALIYFFSQNLTSYEFLKHECCDDGTTASSATISDWLSNCREACLIWLYNECDRDLKLGGPNVVIEVDLCRVGKCKYKTEALAEGTWLLALVELNSKSSGRYRLEVCPGEALDPKSVITLVARHSLPGTRIVTNLWGEYFELSTSGYYHYTVNNSQTFVNLSSEKGCRLINSSWLATKSLLKFKTENMAPYLAEFLYRREVKLTGEDSFAHFLRVIRAPLPSA